MPPDTPIPLLHPGSLHSLPAPNAPRLAPDAPYLPTLMSSYTPTSSPMAPDTPTPTGPELLHCLPGHNAPLTPPDSPNTP